jgi:hypothetical protein
MLQAASPARVPHHLHKQVGIAFLNRVFFPMFLHLFACVMQKEKLSGV